MANLASDCLLEVFGYIQSVSVSEVALAMAGTLHSGKYGNPLHSPHTLHWQVFLAKGAIGTYVRDTCFSFIIAPSTSNLHGHGTTNSFMEVFDDEGHCSAPLTLLSRYS